MWVVSGGRLRQAILDKGVRQAILDKGVLHYNGRATQRSVAPYAIGVPELLRHVFVH